MHANSMKYQPIAYLTALTTVRYHNQHICVARCSTAGWVILVALVHWTHQLTRGLQHLGTVSLQQEFCALGSDSKWTPQNPKKMQKVFF